MNMGTNKLGWLVIGRLRYSFHIFSGSGLFILGHCLQGRGLLHRDCRTIYLKSKAEARTWKNMTFWLDLVKKDTIFKLHVVVRLNCCRLVKESSGSWKKLTPRMWCCHLCIVVSFPVFCTRVKGMGDESEFLKTKILESGAKLKVFANLILGGNVTLKLSAVA